MSNPLKNARGRSDTRSSAWARAVRTLVGTRHVYHMPRDRSIARDILIHDPRRDAAPRTTEQPAAFSFQLSAADWQLLCVQLGLQCVTKSMASCSACNSQADLRTPAAGEIRSSARRSAGV